MVPKSNGKGRLVVDLRRLNECVVQVASTLPNLDMQLSWLPKGLKFFMSLDILSGFDMLKVHPEDQDFFCISTPFGCYKFHGSPQGYCNTPAVFQDRMVADILGGAQEGIFGGDPDGALV